jgi:Spy/CpxP family protein refolding chaperone
MKKNTIWTIIVIALVCINSLVLVLLWRHGKPDLLDGKHTPPQEFLIKQLHLTRPQIEKFEILRRAHHQTVEDLNEKIKQLKDSLFKNLSNTRVKQKTIDSLTNKIGEDYALINKTTFNHFHDLRAILLPEQQEKLDEIMNQVLQMLNRTGPPNGQGNGAMPPPPPNNGQPNDGGEQPDNRPPGPRPPNN